MFPKQMILSDETITQILKMIECGDKISLNNIRFRFAKVELEGHVRSS
jgi:hypothetical protein